MKIEQTDDALTASELTTTDHSRDSAGLNYVYPVLSRRSGGLSIGINFNTNNACNWRCIYCQVPNLQFGAAPAMDFRLLETELKSLLTSVRNGEFYDRFHVPQGDRVIRDIALSGDGEPTSLHEFAEAVDAVGRIATELGFLPQCRFVLITNGSLIRQTRVQEGLARLNHYQGEVWFKLDSATSAGRQLINNTRQSFQSSLDCLEIASQLCSTRLQICVFSIDGLGYPETERLALLQALSQIREKSKIRQVMLYTLARPSRQPEASRIGKVSMSLLSGLADQIRSLGYDVSVSD